MNRKKLINFVVMNLTLMLMPAGDIFYLIPSRITSGGLYGLSIIIIHALGIQANATIWVPIMAFILTSPLLLYSYFKFNRDYFNKTFYATVMMPIYMLLMGLFLKSFGYEVVEANLILATIMGSIIPGVGIGIIMGLGGSTGGTDIIAKIANKYFPFISLGAGVTISNLLITAVTTAMFGIDRGLASVISIVLTGWSIDLTLWLFFKKKQEELE